MYELKDEGFELTSDTTYPSSGYHWICRLNYADAEFSCDIAAAEEAIALADEEHATKKLAIVTATILGLLYNM